MIRFACYNFLLLLFLSQNKFVKSFLEFESSSSWTNKNDINVFMQCFCQNIAQSPAFSRQEKEQFISTMEIMMSRIGSYHRRSMEIQLQTVDTDFALSMAQLVIAEDVSNLHDVSIKINAMSQILTLCSQTTFDVVGKQFLSEVTDLIRVFAEKAKINEEARNEFPVTSSLPHSFSTSSYGEGSNMVANYGESKPTESDLPPAYVSALTNELTNVLAMSDLFQTIFGLGTSSEAAVEIVVPALTRALWSLSISSSVSFTISNSLQSVICTIGHPAAVISYAQAVASSVLTGLSSSGILTADNGPVIISKFLNEFLQASSILATEYGIVVSQNTATETSTDVTTSTMSSSVVDSHPASRDALEAGYDLLIHSNKNMPTRQKRQSLTNWDQDLENCSNSVKLNLEANDSKVLESCSKIFNRLIWDEEADETFDIDIRELIHLLYDGERENVIKVLRFIDFYVPQNVRELIVSYDAIIYEFEKHEDFNRGTNQQYFQQIKVEVQNIKNMKGEHPNVNYNLARQVHKDMLENMLENLNAVTVKESVNITYQDIQNCANSVKSSLVNQTKVLVSCQKIFNRGFWDEKADKNFDDNIRSLIHLVYDSERENVMLVLNFIEQYVPKHVRELIVSYDAIIYEFEKNDDFSLPVNFPNFQRIERNVIDIRGMNRADNPAGSYSSARQIHKDMLENMEENLLAVTERKSITIGDQEIHNCANSLKFDFKSETKILLSCRKIFYRGFWDEEADATLDTDLRMLIQLFFDGKRKNVVKILLFIEYFVPPNVRELIVSYDAIIEEFERNEDFNLPINQPYFQQIKAEVSVIKGMAGKRPAANYNAARHIHKDMLENMLENLNAVTVKESITIGDLDIQNCANSVKFSLVNQTNVIVPCRKIFSRGFWDEKADTTLDGDVRKLIQLIYDGKRENVMLVLNFIDLYVPKSVREIIVSYDTIIYEFEKNDDFNLPLNYPTFYKIKHNVRDIKKMNEEHPAGNYNLALQIHKDMLENLLENLNAVAERKSIPIDYEDIQNCADSVKFNVVNVSEIFVWCRKIFNRGFLDAIADRTLDEDIKKLIQLSYDSGREQIYKVLYFIDEYVPKYVRELIVSYDAFVNEFEKHEDFNELLNEPYVRLLYLAIENIKSMNGGRPAEKYESARQIHKDMLENILEKFTAIEGNNSPTKESVIENCIQAIKEGSSNAESLCNQILKEEDNREWHAGDVSGAVEDIVRGAYNGERCNFKKVLAFVRYKFPYIEQTSKGYQVLLDEMGKHQPLSQEELSEFIEKVTESLSVVANSVEAKTILSDLVNNLNTRFETLKEKVIQSCVNAISSNDLSKAAIQCKKILKKEDNRAWVSGSDYYQADVEEIVRRTYDGNLENLDKVLSFIRLGFPYSSQDVAGYMTFLKELEKHEQLEVNTLNKLLEKVKWSMIDFNIFSDDTKKEFEMLKNRLDRLVEDKEEKTFQAFIKAIQADRFFTIEENAQWQQLYGGFNDYRADWSTFGYVEKLIVFIYSDKIGNFDVALKAISRYYFVDQRVEGYQTLLNEMEKIQQVHEDSLKVLENKIEEVNVNELPDEYKNKFEKVKDRLKILQDIGKVNEVGASQGCIETVQNKNWFQAKITCNKILLLKPAKTPSNELFPEKDDLEHIVISIYANNIANVNQVLKLIDIFPYIHQRLRGYNILLNEIKREKSHVLYFSALNQLKEKIKETIYSNYFEDFPSEHKDRFKKLREDLKELIAKFITPNDRYIDTRATLNHLNETLIDVGTTNMKIIIHYDLPSYFSEYPFENELRILYKQSEECINDYMDFILPEGWMSHASEHKLDVWIFNDQDILGNREGFTNFQSSNQLVALNGMYLYRKKEAGARIQAFKHEFMHILVVGGFGNYNFAFTVPRWFHDGMAELAAHGPCSTHQLNLLKMYTGLIHANRHAFMGMICLSAEQQQKAYPSDWILNYFLSYFNVLYLRLRHPKFLQQIIHEAHQRGWEKSETTSTPSVRNKLCDLFRKEKKIFYSWMEKLLEDQSSCYSDQPNSKFKLTYITDTSKEDGHVLSLSVVSDGKFTWENLMAAFAKEDLKLIDREITLYRASLKQQIENLNLLPLNKDLEQQKSFMDIVLRFLEEIHSRRADISIGYYYYYANSFLQLVFEDIIIPSYQRASLEKGLATVLKGKIRSSFFEFIKQAFSKDLPPEQRTFLDWYRIRCHDVDDFCAPDDYDKIVNILILPMGNTDYIEVSVPK